MSAARKPHVCATPLPGFNTRRLRRTCRLCMCPADVSWPVQNSPHCMQCVHESKQFIAKHDADTRARFHALFPDSSTSPGSDA